MEYLKESRNNRHTHFIFCIEWLTLYPLILGTFHTLTLTRLLPGGHRSEVHPGAPLKVWALEMILSERWILPGCFVSISELWNLERFGLVGYVSACPALPSLVHTYLTMQSQSYHAGRSISHCHLLSRVWQIHLDISSFCLTLYKMNSVIS